MILLQATISALHGVTIYLYYKSPDGFGFDGSHTIESNSFGIPSSTFSAVSAQR